VIAPLCLVLASLAAGPEFQVRTLDGRTVAGAVQELSAESLRIGSAEGPVEVPLASVLSVAPVIAPARPDIRPTVWVDLTDGSLLVGQDYQVEGGLARVGLAAGGQAELSTQVVAAVRLKRQNAAVAAEWAQVLAAEVEGDRIVVQKGQALDFLDGVLGDVTADTVAFTLDGQAVPVKRTRVVGLVYFHPAAAELPPAVCQVTDVLGNALAARQLSAAEGGLRVVTCAGAEVNCPWEHLVRLDFSEGKLVYLSDLKPESSEWQPQFGGPPNENDLKFHGPQTDRALYGAPLTVAGRAYDKGLALPSRTRLVYRLAGKYARFVATVGIDDAVRPAGTASAVRLVIEADGRTLFDEVVAAGQPPRDLDLDLQGARRLTLLADHADGDYNGDHLDLCEAKVVK
jgi:hypothetical protein